MLPVTRWEGEGGKGRLLNAGSTGPRQPASAGRQLYGELDRGQLL